MYPGPSSLRAEVGPVGYQLFACQFGSCDSNRDRGATQALRIFWHISTQYLDLLQSIPFWGSKWMTIGSYKGVNTNVDPGTDRAHNVLDLFSHRPH